MPSASTNTATLALTASMVAVLPASAQRAASRATVAEPTTQSQGEGDIHLAVNFTFPSKPAKQTRAAIQDYQEFHGYTVDERQGKFVQDGECFQWGLGCREEFIRTRADGTQDCGPTDEHLVNFTMNCETQEKSPRFFFFFAALLAVAAVAAVVKVAAVVAFPMPMPMPMPKPMPMPMPHQNHKPMPHQPMPPPAPRPTTPYPPAEITDVKTSGDRANEDFKSLGRGNGDEGDEKNGDKKTDEKKNLGRNSLRSQLRGGRRSGRSARGGRGARASRSSRASRWSSEESSVEGGDASVGEACRVGAVSCGVFYGVLATAMLCVAVLLLGLWKAKNAKAEGSAGDRQPSDAVKVIEA